MTFFCTQCWREVPPTATICPQCGDDIARRQSAADYTDKLIAALGHPEPTTPLRAAWILGRRRERRAVPELVRLTRTSSDAFAVAAAVQALAAIGGAEAEAIVEWARRQPAAVVRPAAACELAKGSDYE